MDIKSGSSRKKSRQGDEAAQIMPSVRESKVSEKKHKKKKSKKHKKRKKTKRSESDTDSSSESDEWGEKDSKEEVSKPKPDARDEWMSMPGLFPCVVKEKRQPVKRDDAEKMILETMGQSKYELNPYWKDGGTGLPSATKSACGEPSDGAKKPNPVIGGTVGDQGADWLRRALTRAEEQARSEGRSLEAVAAERWGSLEKLQSMLAEAEQRAGNSKSLGKNQTRYNDNQRSERRYNDQEGRERIEDRRRDQGRRGRDEDRRDDQGSRGRRDERRDQERRERDEDRSSQRSRGFHKPRGDDEDTTSGGRFKKPDDEDSHARPSSNRREGGWRKRESNSVEREGTGSRQNDSHSKQTSRITEMEIKPIVSQPKINEPHANPKASATQTLKTTPVKRTAPEESSSEPSSDEALQAEVEERLSDKEMNELGARLIKAEILGNETLAAELRSRLESARAARAAAPSSADSETMLLTLQDAAGNVRPARGDPDPAVGKPRKRKPAQTHDRDGNRARYFPDDDDRSLKDMFEREKMSSVEDSNKQFLDMVAKVKPGDELDAAFEDSASRQRETGDRGRALAQAKRVTAALDDCQWCYHGKRLARHLVIAAGEKVFLCVPAYRSLTLGHCLVVPINHVASATQLDEDVWAEIQLFRRGLAAMFSARDEDVVFFETATRLRHRPHMRLECVPLPRDEGATAPIFFKKAILECESEWSTNHKLVDTRKSSVRRCLPRELPYFAVDFGAGGGFAHVIEDEQAFPDTFAQEIVAGMLDLDHDSWRKPPRENFEKQREKVLQLSAWWKPHDFTASQSDGADSS